MFSVLFVVKKPFFRCFELTCLFLLRGLRVFFVFFVVIFFFVLFVLFVVKKLVFRCRE